MNSYDRVPPPPREGGTDDARSRLGGASPRRRDAGVGGMADARSRLGRVHPAAVGALYGTGSMGTLTPLCTHAFFELLTSGFRENNFSRNDVNRDGPLATSAISKNGPYHRTPEIIAYSAHTHRMKRGSLGDTLGDPVGTQFGSQQLRFSLDPFQANLIFFDENHIIAQDHEILML